MLKQLIKYEFKATMRTILPFYLGIIILAALNYNVFANSTIEQYGWFNIATLVVLSFAILGVFLLSTVIIITRFYKNMFGDEGYLTHTLPATTMQLINSKLVVAMTWALGNFLIIVVVAFLLSGGRIVEISQMAINEALHYMPYTNLVELTILGGVVILFGLWCSLLNYYAAMSIGQLSPKNKFVYSVLAYLAISWTIGLLTNGVTELVTRLHWLDWMAKLDGLTIARITMGVLIFRSVFLGVLFLWATHYLIKHKLNLE